MNVFFFIWEIANNKFESNTQKQHPPLDSQSISIQVAPCTGAGVSASGTAPLSRVLVMDELQLTTVTGKDPGRMNEVWNSRRM